MPGISFIRRRLLRHSLEAGLGWLLPSRGSATETLIANPNRLKPLGGHCPI